MDGDLSGAPQPIGEKLRQTRAVVGHVRRARAERVDDVVEVEEGEVDLRARVGCRVQGGRRGSSLYYTLLLHYR